MRNVRVREVAFWIASPLLAGTIVALDYAVAFVYVPRWLPALLLFVFLFPTRVNASYWARATVCLLLVALPFALAPVRWNLLKAFYLDCVSLEHGLDRSSTLVHMAPYQLGSPTWGLLHGEGGAEKREYERVIITPSLEYGSDWCILYFSDERLHHVEISPD